MNLPFHFLGGPGSSKAEQVDRIIDKERFYHISMGKLLISELKHTHPKNGLSMDHGGAINIQKYFCDWQNGELMNSVQY